MSNDIKHSLIYIYDFRPDDQDTIEKCRQRVKEKPEERGYLEEGIAAALFSKNHWHRIRDFIKQKGLENEFNQLEAVMLPIGEEQIIDAKEAVYVEPIAPNDKSDDKAKFKFWYFDRPESHKKFSIKYNYTLNNLSEEAHEEFCRIFAEAPIDSGSNKEDGKSS